MTTDYRDFYRELRTDWLKLRGYLYDTNTRLPALPAVLDQVRRRLEVGEELGLIYLEPSGGELLEATCGWQAYDELVRQIAEAVRGYRLAHLGAEDTVAQAEVRSDEILIFVALNGDEAAGDRLEALRRTLTEQVGDTLDALDSDHQPQLQSAALVLCLDPKVRIERSLYQSLQIARDQCRRETERSQSRRLGELRRMLREADVLTRYQPIVDLEGGGIHGLEALSSAPCGRFFSNPELLFAFAEENDALVELERVCRREATRRVVNLVRHDGVAAGSKLFLNCSARSFADPELLRDLARRSLGAGLDPNDLVVEVTERVAITERRRFQQALDELRSSGLKIAIDDMGVGYSSLHSVAEIQPDYLKFDFSLVHNLHRSSIKRDLLETLVVLADKIGARSIAEGIETVEELETVREMGIEFGQGYFLAPPAPAPEVGVVHFPVEDG